MSPFKSQDEAIRHCIDLLAVEAENSGTRLTNADRDCLAGGDVCSPALQEKAKDAIRRVYERKERLSERESTDFSNSLQYASGGRNANVIELARQVADERNRNSKLHGWPLLRDRALLILSAVGVGLVILVAGYFITR